MPLVLSGNGQITGFSDTFSWAQTVNDPLTSLASVSTYGTTWSINTNLQRVGSGRATFNVGPAINPAADIHIVEGEVEIPTGWSSTQHIKFGWGVDNATGYVKAGIQANNNGYFEADAVSSIQSSAYILPPAGTWLKVRVKWIPAQSQFQLFLGGVFHSSVTRTQAIPAGMTPSMTLDTAASTVTSRYRNFKAWSLTRYPASPFPSDPA